MNWTDYEKEEAMNLGAPLIGKTIVAVEISGDELRLTTSDGTVRYGVEGDCCSSSYFYDIHGVEKLLNGGPVLEMNSIPLDEPDDEDARRGEVVRAYGYEIVSDHPEFGEVTTAFSFRNDSNGYYGGWMYLLHESPRFSVNENQLPLVPVIDTWTYDA